MADLLKEKNLLTKKGSSSPIWKFFGFEVNPDKPNEALDTKRVVCALCGKNFSFSSGTSTMHKHLKTLHTREWRTMDATSKCPTTSATLPKSEDSGHLSAQPKPKDTSQQSIVVSSVSRLVQTTYFKHNRLIKIGV